jgi:CheY-like chemotaxis protein
MNGSELGHKIRAERPELPLIFISANLDETAYRRALDVGALGCMAVMFIMHEPYAVVSPSLEVFVISGGRRIQCNKRSVCRASG